MAKLAHALQSHLEELKATGHPKWKEVDLNAEVGIWKRDTCSARVLSPSCTTTAAAPAPVREDKDNALGKDLIGVIRGTSSR